MTKIKFGTDGWRAIIAKDFTVENVARVTEAVSQWIIRNKKTKSIVLGHDCRFAGELFAETAAKVFVANGIKVFLAKGFVSTPMVSLGTKTYGASIGVVLTASHNPPSYNGYKLKSEFGGPLSPVKVQEIEDIIPDQNIHDLEVVSIEEYIKQGKVEIVPLEELYIKHVEKNFDLEMIRRSGLKLAYDAMYGAGQRVVPAILPATALLHCDYNPSFKGQAPEPIDKNLKEFSQLIKEGKYECGLATDGDADRIGLYNGKGEFVDSHHIILLLIHYLVKYKGMKGKVVTAFSTTPRVKKMCDHYGLESEVVKIGFKYIADIMVDQDVLVGGEESGGIAIKGHIPERDGIWMGLVIWEFMAKSGKTLEELIKEVYEITGSFFFERNDLHLREEVKQKIVNQTAGKGYDSFGEYRVSNMENIDGYKYYFQNDEWVMIRASGTEPVLRLYAESNSPEGTAKILDAVKKTILS